MELAMVITVTDLKDSEIGKEILSETKKELTLFVATYHTIMNKLLQAISPWTGSMMTAIRMKKHAQTYHTYLLKHKWDHINPFLFYLVKGAADFFDTQLSLEQLQRSKR